MNRLLALARFASLPLNAYAESAVVGTGTPASCTTSTYNAALSLVVNDNQGGVLTFNCGENPHTIPVSTAHILQNFVVIDGGGRITLNAQDQTRFYVINQDGPKGQTQITLQNITLDRGASGAEPFGGAVLVNANTRLDLNNVTISNSLASVSGGAIATFANVTLNIDNSRFLGNLAANGGAIATRATVTVFDSTFSNNNASGGEGGAIQSYEQQVNIVRSRFLGNSARLGGAIFKGNAELYFSESSFDGNTSGEDGGAIYLRADVSFADAEYSVLRNNAAVRDGGALFTKGSAYIEDSAFSGNSARAGGAIRSDGGELSLERVTLNDNTARTEGGAISSLAVSALIGRNPHLLYVTTSNNSATEGNGGDFAFLSSNGIAALIENCTLMGGTASGTGSTLHVSGSQLLEVERSLIWAAAGNTCSTSTTTSITSLGSNIGALGCGMNAPSDAISSTFAGFGLAALAHNGGRIDTFLPQPGSAAIDRGGMDCFWRDARELPSPIDGDGNGSVLCDAGAVERQLVEVPGALFRSSFESTGQQ